MWKKKTTTKTTITTMTAIQVCINKESQFSGIPYVPCCFKIYFISQYCGLGKITRSPKVPNQEILGALST